MNTYRDYLECSNGILSELSSEDKVCDIYHYTSPVAFKSIIENKCLRFTDRFYLNDLSEGYYTLDLCIDNIEKILDTDHPLASSKDTILNKLKEYRQTFCVYRYKIYQMSFSVDKDCLCLWNYYANGNGIGGYNLHFQSDEVCQGLKLYDKKDYKPPYVFRGKVIYKEDEQIEKIKEFINKFYDAILNDNNGDSSRTCRFFLSHLDMIIERLTLLGTFFKAPYFEAEKEYRIALDLCIDEGKVANLIADRNFDYRHGMYIPYFDIKFSLDAIKSIRISPTSNFEECKRNLEVFFEGKGIGDIDIEPSKIPVRY